MTEWKPKPGEWVMYEVRELKVTGPSVFAFSKTLGSGGVDTRDLLPITQPDPHQVLKDAVVEAAITLRKKYFDGTAKYYGSGQLHHFAVAVDALQAAQRPPSRYAGLRKAWHSLGVEEIGAEISKLEAEERT